MAPPLSDWQNFYVVVGSAAAGLTGLTFVVIALAADAQMVRLSGLRAFITPIVVHFGTVLWLAALLCIPGHNRTSLALCMIGTALIGAVYALTTTYRMVRTLPDYRPVAADWIWNAVLPLLSHGVLLAAGLMTAAHAPLALYLIGAVALTLLYVGIHNAWDLAVWITAERPSARAKHEAQDQSDTAAATPAATEAASAGDSPEADVRLPRPP